MKKTLSAVLIGSMLLMPASVLAVDEDDYIHSLRFDKIKEEIEARNPTMAISREKLHEGSENLDTKPIKVGVENLEARRDQIISDLEKGTYIKLAQELTTIPINNTQVKVYTFSLDGADRPFAGLLEGKSNIIVFSQEPSAPKITKMTGTVDLDKAEATVNTTELEKLNDYINYNLLKLYMYQLSSLNMQVAQIEAQKENLWKSYLQLDMAEDQIVWGAQQLYLAYYGLTQTKDNLQTNIEMLQKKLAIQQLRVSLGLATQTDGFASEIQIKELNMALDKLNQSMNDIKGQLNVMLGQDFDTELNLSEPSYVTQSKLRAMDYEEDLEDALNQSYNVRLKDDSDEIEDAERSFTLAFHQAYQNVQDKKKALELEKLKLDNEQLKYDHNTLMNTLGLISNIDFEGLRSLYLTQVNKVKTAEQDLLQAYTAYDWMKKGLTVSTGAGSAGASSASSATAPTSMTGAPSSGMGF